MGVKKYFVILLFLTPKQVRLLCFHIVPGDLSFLCCEVFSPVFCLFLNWIVVSLKKIFLKNISSNSILSYIKSFLVAQMVKNLPARQETWVRSLVWGDPGRSEWQPAPVFLPGESHGQRSLAGYSPWGCREWDTTGD